MRRWALILVAAAGCARSGEGREDPARAIAAALPVSLPPETPLYAGLDLKLNLPPGVPDWTAAEWFDFDPDTGVVERTFRWRWGEGFLVITALIGQQGAREVLAALPGAVRPYAREASRTDSVGDVAVEAEGRLVAFVRGNVGIVLAGEADLAAMARFLDERVREQPPLTSEAFPRLAGIKAVGDLERVRSGTMVQLTLQVEGEEGLLPAGWKIRETARRVTAMMHVQWMTFALIAGPPGRFHVRMWVINLRGLAAVREIEMTVLEG